MRRVCPLRASLLAPALFAAGCAFDHSPIRDTSLDDALHRAAMAGFETRIVSTAQFELMVKTRFRRPGRETVAYIEGDGMAWLSRDRPSSDPTPRNPLALALATADPRDNVAYIARPCQYVLRSGHGRGCEPRYWTSHRYSAEVVAALDDAVTQMAKEAASPAVELVGYSGGGGLAVLLASKRSDVSILRTVAGNLDHKALSEHHGVSLLAGSANAIDVAPEVRSLCQYHYSGAGDDVVPGFIAERFLTAMGHPSRGRFISVEGADHWAGWIRVWPALLGEGRSCDGR